VRELRVGYPGSAIAAGLVAESDRDLLGHVDAGVVDEFEGAALHQRPPHKEVTVPDETKARVDVGGRRTCGSRDDENETQDQTAPHLHLPVLCADAAAPPSRRRLRSSVRLCRRGSRNRSLVLHCRVDDSANCEEAQGLVRQPSGSGEGRSETGRGWSVARASRRPPRPLVATPDRRCRGTRGRWPRCSRSTARRREGRGRRAPREPWRPRRRRA